MLFLSPIRLPNHRFVTNKMLKKLVCRFFTKRPIDKKTNSPNKNIGKDHQVHDSVIDPFSSTLIGLALEYGPTHRTLPQ